MIVGTCVRLTWCDLNPDHSLSVLSDLDISSRRSRLPSPVAAASGRAQSQTGSIRRVTTANGATGLHCERYELPRMPLRVLLRTS